MLKDKFRGGRGGRGVTPDVPAVRPRLHPPATRYGPTVWPRRFALSHTGSPRYRYAKSDCLTQGHPDTATPTRAVSHRVTSTPTGQLGLSHTGSPRHRDTSSGCLTQGHLDTEMPARAVSHRVPSTPRCQLGLSHTGSPRHRNARSTCLNQPRPTSRCRRALSEPPRIETVVSARTVSPSQDRDIGVGVTCSQPPRIETSVST
jgi:hypothetical protein